jgi:ribonuclease-3
MLADAFEALVGAIHLDAGYVSARAVVERLYDSLIVAPGQAMKDAKTRLQEHLQGTRQALPVYALRATLGDAHAQVFEVACELNDLGITTLGRGTSRRQAEQQAAAAALTEIERR